MVIKLLPFKGQIKDDKTGAAIPANIVIRTKDHKDSLRTDSVGNFETLLPLGEVAGIDVYAKDYFFETKMFKVTPQLKKDFSVALKKVAIGEKVDIKNLFFVGNKAILLKRALPELPKLLKFMELNDSIKIEIAGHINRPNYPKMIYQFMTRPKVDPQKLIEMNKALMGFNLIWLYEKADLMDQILAEVGNLQLQTPHVGHTFSFEDLPKSIKLFQTGKTIGKVVVIVSHQTS